MAVLAKYLSSQSNTLVLECLALRTNPCHLRQLARLTGLHVHSVENALSDLGGKKILVRSTDGHRVLWKWNDAHADSGLLKGVFSFASKEALKAQGAQYDQKAQRLLRFLDSSLELFRKVKRQ